MINLRPLFLGIRSTSESITDYGVLNGIIGIVFLEFVLNEDAVGKNIRFGQNVIAVATIAAEGYQKQQEEYHLFFHDACVLLFYDAKILLFLLNVKKTCLIRPVV